MNNQQLKEELFRQCEIFVSDKLATVRSRIEDLERALQSETKSSAGDKHETGRAMLQLEREKAGQQLAEINHHQETIVKLLLSKAEVGKLGAVVKTNLANYFISISAGKLSVDKELFFAVSAVSPIGKLLLGKQKGEVVSFNGKEIEITALF